MGLGSMRRRSRAGPGAGRCGSRCWCSSVPAEGRRPQAGCRLPPGKVIEGDPGRPTSGPSRPQTPSPHSLARASRPFGSGGAAQVGRSALGHDDVDVRARGSRTGLGESGHQRRLAVCDWSGPRRCSARRSTGSAAAALVGVAARCHRARTSAVPSTLTWPSRSISTAVLIAKHRLGRQPGPRSWVKLEPGCRSGRPSAQSYSRGAAGQVGADRLGPTAARAGRDRRPHRSACPCRSAPGVVRLASSSAVVNRRRTDLDPWACSGSRAFDQPGDREVLWARAGHPDRGRRPGHCDRPRRLVSNRQRRAGHQRGGRPVELIAATRCPRRAIAARCQGHLAAEFEIRRAAGVIAATSRSGRHRPVQQRRHRRQA